MKKFIFAICISKINMIYDYSKNKVIVRVQLKLYNYFYYKN